MRKYSLTKQLLGSEWLEDGAIANSDGTISKAFEVEPFSSGALEESFDGAISDAIFSKLADLLSKLPNHFDGQVLLNRRRMSNTQVPGLSSKLYFFEKCQKVESYSHLNALLSELKITLRPITKSGWQELLTGFLGESIQREQLPDALWERDSIKIEDRHLRVLKFWGQPFQRITA